jgi:hypothetical protein
LSRERVCRIEELRKGRVSAAALEEDAGSGTIHSRAEGDALALAIGRTITVIDDAGALAT